MVSLILSEEVDTTWAFIRMIEHWNENEWWRPFSVVTFSCQHRKPITISGEVSTEGRFRNCTDKIHTRKCQRIYFNMTNTSAYDIVLRTFIPKPRSLEVVVPDHKNRNSMDNRVANLRWCTLSLNQLNREDMFDENGKLKSGLGVRTYRTRRGLRHFVRISYKNQKISLGAYDTMEEADDVYRRARRDMFEIMM